MDNAMWLAALGLGAIALEFALPTKGALAVMGAILFVIGTIGMVNNPNIAIQLTWPSAIVLNLVVLGTLTVVAIVTIRNYARDTTSTTHPYIGQKARVIEWENDTKRVELAGSIWQATSLNNQNFHSGEMVIVTGQNNLTVTVAPIGEHA